MQILFTAGCAKNLKSKHGILLNIRNVNTEWRDILLLAMPAVRSGRLFLVLSEYDPAEAAFIVGKKLFFEVLAFDLLSI